MLDPNASPLELYDAIMGQIEPDLTTKQLPLLEDRYNDETEGGFRLRMSAYARAFQIFAQIVADLDGIFAEGLALWKEELHDFLREREQGEAKGDLQSIERELDSFSSTP